MDDKKIVEVLYHALDLIDRADQKTWNPETVAEADPLLRHAYRTISVLRRKISEPRRRFEYSKGYWYEDGERLDYPPLK